MRSIMRSFKLALGFVLTASVAAAQSYPSPTFSGVNVTTGGTYKINSIPLLGLSGTSAVLPAPVISDFAYPGLNVTKDMYRVNTGSFPFNDEYAGVGNTVSSIVGLINIPAGTVTGAHIFDSGVSGYAQTSNTLRDAIGLYGEGAILVNGASAYGLNTEVINCENHSTTNCGYGKGKNMGQLWSIEADVSIYKVGSAAPTGDVTGVVAVAYAETQPTGQFNAFQVAQNTNITGSQPWKVGLTIGDATASTAAIVVGSFAHYTSSAVGSMPMFFMTYNSAGTQVPLSIYADADTNFRATSSMILTSTSNTFVSLSNLTSGVTWYQISDTSGNWQLYNANGVQMQFTSAGNATINHDLAINGVINAPSLPTSGGTVKGSLCIDTIGVIYVKTTTGACK